MRAVFFGTPEIAVPALSALAKIAEVTAVVCQPDRPSGRGLALKPPAVKQHALALGIEVLQPTKVRVPEFAAWLRDQRADVALVMAYGRILPLGVLAAPRRGCMNLHASLLPKYRGAAPITWAIVDGERETGVSLMQMDEGMDTGAVFSMHRIPIGEDVNAADLAESLAHCAASVVKSDLQRAVEGQLIATPQPGEGVSHARMLTKADGKVDFSLSAEQVHNHIRGMSPWPGAHTTLLLGGVAKQLKLLKTARTDDEARARPGTITVRDKQLYMHCGTGQLELVTAQLEGKKALGAADLLAGRSLADGMVLGQVS